MSTKQKHYYTVSHRGDENTNFKLHSRASFKFKDLDVNSLLVLAFIDIDQFQDYRFKKGGKRNTLKMVTFTEGLGMSETTVKRALIDLKKRGAISFEHRKKIGTSYISNILKLQERYQIITLSFIIRLDISLLTKAFILKLLMSSSDRINNIGNISAISKDLNMSRNSIYKVFKELETRQYIIEVEEAIFAIDIERVMLESDIIIQKEVIDLRARNKYLINEIKKLDPLWGRN